MMVAAAAGAASQLLSTLLSKLSSSSATSSSSTSSTSTVATSAFQQAMPGAGKSAISAPPTSPLSGDMLMALMSLQAQSGATAATPTSASSSSSAANPVQQLFSAMDSDGDGNVSQSEMESYIEKQGGTQGQADSLFSTLNQTNSAGGSSSGISESQMANAVSQAQQAHQTHGGHHYHKSGGANEQADNTASALLQALDGNDDGSVSEDEFSSFITANGGTAADASSDFAALNTSGSNALTSADFAKAFNAYQTQQNTQSPGSMVVSLLNQLAGASGTTSISA
ncbi:MAG TPA: EF-hand domain-containing protein [Rhizomicrobium sp.]|jgi:Ca2+-binding EF-hand superfamily protein